jgi:hypothetical protein
LAFLRALRETPRRASADLTIGEAGADESAPPPRSARDRGEAGRAQMVRYRARC